MAQGFNPPPHPLCESIVFMLETVSSNPTPSNKMIIFEIKFILKEIIIWKKLFPRNITTFDIEVTVLVKL